MARLCALALLGGMLILAGDLAGQDSKKEDPKTTKKVDPPTKIKGRLPSGWGKLGLTDAQKQSIYKVQGKHDEEIDKLEAKLKELKATQLKEMRAILTAEQRKTLDSPKVSP